jgi:hypothetical protein
MELLQRLTLHWQGSQLCMGASGAGAAADSGAKAGGGPAGESERLAQVVTAW